MREQRDQSVLGYVGFISICVLPPLLVCGGYIAGVEQMFGKRVDRVLALLRSSDHPTCRAAAELWETRRQEAEQAKQNKEAQRALGKGPAELAQLFNTMDAKGAENFAKFLNDNPPPAYARCRTIMEPIVGAERLAALLDQPSADFLKAMSTSSDQQLRALAEAFNKLAPDSLRTLAANFREPQQAPETTSESLGRAAVYFRFGYYVARIFAG